MNRLQTIAQKHFIETMLELLELWHEKFPDCRSTSEHLVYFSGVIIGDGDKEIVEIKRWDQCMSLAINPKIAKYAKPVERILGEAPACYLACFYKDVDAIFGCDDLSDEMKSINITEKYKSDEFSIEDRTLFWKFIQTLNQNALSFLNKEMQRPPLRQEIQENIRKHKQAKEIQAGPPSMVKAFHASFIAFMDAIGEVKPESSKELKEYARTTDPTELLSNWTEMLTSEKEFTTKCNECDTDWLGSVTWTALPVEFHNIVKNALSTEDKSKQLCSILDQMNSFSSVRKHIPSGMMGQIENYAFKLAEDINSGKCDLNSINLQQIGQDVLQNCDSKEMMAMADNIGELLPTLQNLRSTMGGN